MSVLLQLSGLVNVHTCTIPSSSSSSRAHQLFFLIIGVVVGVVLGVVMSVLLHLSGLM